jgi:glycine cleavage system H protein
MSKYYTETHEWVTIEEEIATVGLTSQASKELGDIVYIEFPKVGSFYQEGQPICVLESTKAAIDLYAPVSGTVVKVNRELAEHAPISFDEVEEGGWLFQIALKHPVELEKLLSLQEYRKLF